MTTCMRCSKKLSQLQRVWLLCCRDTVENKESYICYSCNNFHNREFDDWLEHQGFSHLQLTTLEKEEERKEQKRVDKELLINEKKCLFCEKNVSSDVWELEIDFSFEDYHGSKKCCLCESCGQALEKNNYMLTEWKVRKRDG